MKISIIIPTHNRAKFLVKTIESALELDYPKNNYEIIIVENACTDDTNYLIRKIIKKRNIKNINLIHENLLGVHFARHAGVRASKSEILFFTDDDCLIDKHLITSYLEAFKQYPNMAAAGGPIKPVWEIVPPEWLVRFIGRKKSFYSLSFFDLYNKFHLDRRGILISANLAIKKDVFRDIGGFNPELIGENYIGDGETGLYKKLWAKRLLIGYIPNALVYHYIPKERMTVDYLIKRMINEGASNMYSRFHSGIPKKRYLMIQVLLIIIRNLKLFLAAIIYRGKTDVNSLNIQLEAARLYSQILYILRLIFDQHFRSLVLKKDWLN